MQLHILGAGTPTPTPAKFGSAEVLEIDGEHLLFDCGPATTHKLVKAGLDPTKIRTVFFTHHHFDHDADFPCFALCRWDQGAGRIPDLEVFGPPPTSEFVRRLFDADVGAFSFDWKARIAFVTSQHVYANRGGVPPRRPPAVRTEEIEPGYTVSRGGWSLKTGYAKHAQPYLDSIAYRVDTPDSSVVITGDTEPCREVVDLASGANTLVSMCWDLQEDMDHAHESVGQTGALGAAQMAADAGVRRLVLTHMGPRVSTSEGRSRALESVARVFAGQVVFAEELTSVDLG